MITLAIPTYNRIDFLFESFSNVISDKRITEICIVDDCSDINIYNTIINNIEYLKLENTNYNKIKIYRNESNLGSFFNKNECVKKSNNDWVILLDSDNIIDKNYIDIVEPLNDPLIIYSPSHAVCDSPFLNYKEHSGKLVNITEYKNLLLSNHGGWDCIFNTGNYYFNRKNYLKCIELENVLDLSFASDAYYLVYLWFKNLKDSKFKVVEELSYIHRLHTNSHYVNNSNMSFNFLNEIKNRVNLWN